MGVGYAAFSSQLKISGTSNIGTNFLVKITDIQSSVQSGGASDAEAPTHDDTTATFKTNLVSPGDSMKYDITVENQGNIDAVLESIEINDGNNPAITFQTSGIEEGDELQVSQSDILTVIVSYDSNVTSQPENTNSTITVYRGLDPDNYITFNGETWRIISKETDGTYKIIKNDVLANRAYDNQDRTVSSTYCTSTSGCGVYAAVDGTFSSPSGSQSGTVTEDSSIKIYLNDDYYVNNINETAKGQMTSHSFNIGAVERLDQSGAEADSIEKNISGEKKYQWTGNVGLANVSDILRASTNPLCTSATTSYDGTNECNSNYLLNRGTASSLFYWTINAYSRESGGSSDQVWYGDVNRSLATLAHTRAGNSSYAPRPVVFLKSDTTLSGSGTSEDPFTIV